MKKIAMLPVYNEEKSIVQVLTKAAEQGIDRFIILNDGSEDSSEDKIKQWINGRSDVFFLSFPKNQGVARIKGIGFCLINHLLQKGAIDGEDIVIKFDTDGQHNPKYIKELEDYMIEKKVDMVLARRDFSKYPPSKVIGNLGITKIANVLTNFKFHDSMSGFKLIKAKIIPELLKYYTGYRYAAAQEISMIPALLNFKIDNDHIIDVEFYKKGARIRDGISVAIMSIIAFLRVKLGWSYDVGRRTQRTLFEIKETIDKFPEINKDLL